MLLFAISGACLALAIGPSQDTTFTVDPNARLELINREGSVSVRTWDRNEIRVSSDLSWGAVIDVERSSHTVRIGHSWRYGDDDDDDIEYRLTVPSTMALHIGGRDTDVRIDGAAGEVNVDVHEGDVDVWGGTGRVYIRNDEGDVYLEGANGQIRVTSMDGDVTIENSGGEIEVEATDGAITLRRIVASAVAANTVDGDIWFDGEIVARGRYSFTTHDGDIEMLIPETTDARVRMALRDGEFSSNFTITVPNWPSGRRVEFDLGEGSADLRIESFDGDISLRHSRGGRIRNP